VTSKTDPMGVSFGVRTSLVMCFCSGARAIASQNVRRFLRHGYHNAEGATRNARIVPSSLPAMRPLITPSPEGLTVNFKSPMKATAPVASAPARKTPVVSNPKLP
jgi:hypothetical protein